MRNRTNPMLEIIKGLARMADEKVAEKSKVKSPKEEEGIAERFEAIADKLGETLVDGWTKKAFEFHKKVAKMTIDFMEEITNTEEGASAAAIKVGLASLDSARDSLKASITEVMESEANVKDVCNCKFHRELREKKAKNNKK